MTYSDNGDEESSGFVLSKISRLIYELPDDSRVCAYLRGIETRFGSTDKILYDIDFRLQYLNYLKVSIDSKASKKIKNSFSPSYNFPDDIKEIVQKPIEDNNDSDNSSFVSIMSDEQLRLLTSTSFEIADE